MADQFDVHIITPERVILSRKAKAVSLPGGLGEMQILPDHARLFSTIDPGQIIVTVGNANKIFINGAGFIEVADNDVKILVDFAIGNEDIDPVAAQALINEAADRLKKVSSEEVEQRFSFETELASAKVDAEVFRKTQSSTLSDETDTPHDNS
ncbi:MAG: ATP synthase F1 subunit epsilon [Proteobacteria bacterium]|nr:ATP synthase F1 subunit epsilon [Pseudomonadota bacterium]